MMPGDEIKVDCVYNSLSRNTMTNYGEATTNEMCFGFITYYDAVASFEFCSQYQNVSFCSISDVASCNVKILKNLMIQMSDPHMCPEAACSSGCRQLAASANATGCLTGDLGEAITSKLPPALVNSLRQCAVSGDGTVYTTVSATVFNKPKATASGIRSSKFLLALSLIWYLMKPCFFSA